MSEKEEKVARLDEWLYNTSYEVKAQLGGRVLRRIYSDFNDNELERHRKSFINDSPREVARIEAEQMRRREVEMFTLKEIEYMEKARETYGPHYD